eukprot:TRINITY_DN25282_c0_g1_i1.p1 TRINITY_DN25282_c0_g1~~TRINITY_DN25282_c0_g1_i1.p1  ORF type:complete len:387 (+),score=113.53 TRINITY_DN25282_c0_g1_i1:38-1198(+)
MSQAGHASPRSSCSPGRQSTVAMEAPSPQCNEPVSAADNDTVAMDQSLKLKQCKAAQGEEWDRDAHDGNEPFEGNAKSPFTWNMAPASEIQSDDGDTNVVSVSHVDQAIGARASNHAALAAFINFWAAVLYITDAVIVYVCIGYWLIDCNDQWIGGGALCICCLADWLMAVFGRLLRQQSVFFWPMTLKLIPFVPIFEVQWWLRARREWQKEQDGQLNGQEDAPPVSPHLHMTRFLHGFACIICGMRIVVFSIPNVLLMILVHYRTDPDYGPDKIAIVQDTPKALMYSTAAIRGAFLIVTIIYMFEVNNKAKRSTVPLCCGIPTLGACRNQPFTVAFSIFLLVSIYTLVFFVGLMITDSNDCSSPADSVATAVPATGVPATFAPLR